MNYQHFEKKALIGWLQSIAKNKSKMVLTEKELLVIIKDENLLNKIKTNLKEAVFIDEIEYDEFPRILLSSLGAISQCSTSGLVFGPIYKKYKDMDDEQLKILNDFVAFLTSEVTGKKTKSIDMFAFLEPIFDSNEYTLEHKIFAKDVVDAFFEHYISSPNSIQSKYDNIDPISLNDLYKNENPNSVLGNFFDQRYIDYLYANRDDLFKMHWRKFEELTAQFFENDGYSVTLGPGRKDGGIDIIATKERKAVIIQCKRWKSKVNSDIVKVLHDDISYNKASRGTIVSLRGLSDDAKKLIKERKYDNIETISQDEILQFLSKYKTTL